MTPLRSFLAVLFIVVLSGGLVAFAYLTATSPSRPAATSASEAAAHVLRDLDKLDEDIVVARATWKQPEARAEAAEQELWFAEASSYVESMRMYATVGKDRAGLDAAWVRGARAEVRSLLPPGAKLPGS